MLRRVLALGTLSLTLSGCGLFAVPPPASQIPTGDAALARIAETQACGRGVRAKATIDHFGKEGRIRGDLMFYAVAPDLLRMDAVSPFGAVLATLASDGKGFSLYDIRDKRFLYGPATPCNIARLTQVPLPGHVLIGLLRGLPPELVHPKGASTIRWSSSGYYVVNVPSSQQAREELTFGVHPDDLTKPWNQQRLRLLSAQVDQYDGTVFRAELEGHQPVPPAPEEEVLPGEAPTPASGPQCSAELPRSIHMEVPPAKSDVLFRYDEVVWNPPLPSGTFTQPNPPGLPAVFVKCD